MKKKLLLLLMVSSSLAAFSQTEKGSFQAGGSLSLAWSSMTMYSNTESSTQFTFTPQLGYFVMNNFSVMISASFYSDKIKNEMNSAAAKSYTVGPFIRYYIPSSEKLKFLLGAGIGFGSTSGVLDYSTHSIIAYQFEAGPSFFISRSVAVETAIYYQYTKYKGTESFYDGKLGQFGINISLMLFLHAGKK